MLEDCQLEREFSNIALEQKFLAGLARSLPDFSFDSKVDDKKSVLVALSGGPDSVFLLFLLKKLCSRALSISACHVNHGLREAASADARFCEELCRELDLSFHLETLSIADRSENALRNARYQALAKVASLNSIPYIVCGHNLDDQVETFLLRLFRGTAPSGATAIKASRKLVSDFGDRTLLRPMLGISRSEIESYLAFAGLSFVTDESNLQPGYTRNFLRLSVLPLLRERFGKVDERIEQFRRILLSEDDLLKELTESLLKTMRLEGQSPESADLKFVHGYARAPLEKAPEALRRRALAMILEENGLSSDFQTIERLAQSVRNFTPCNLPSDKSLIFKEDGRGEIFFAIGQSAGAACDPMPPFAPVPIALPLSGSAHTVIAALNCVLKVTALRDDEPEAELEKIRGLGESERGFKEVLSLPEGSELVFRARQPGDHIQPLGMPGSLVRLKKYLHGRGGVDAPGIFKLRAGVTRALKSKLSSPESTLRHLPVLVLGQEVVWVPGFGIGEAASLKVEGQRGPEQNSVYLIELIELGGQTNNGGASDSGTC